MDKIIYRPLCYFMHPANYWCNHPYNDKREIGEINYKKYRFLEHNDKMNCQTCNFYQAVKRTDSYDIIPDYSHYELVDEIRQTIQCFCGCDKMTVRILNGKKNMKVYCSECRQEIEI